MSELSKVTGLDAHPAALAAINNVLRTAGTAAGLPEAIVGKPDATAANPTGTGSTIAAHTSTPSGLLASVEAAGLSVGVPALKAVIATLVTKIPDTTPEDQAALSGFLDRLIDNVVKGIK